MGRSDQYMNCNKLFQRFELEGEPLIITEKQSVTRYRHEDLPTVCIRWKGLHRIRHGEEEYLADESVVFDSGPKLGVSVTVTRHSDTVITKEERQANRDQIDAVMMQICGRRVDWEKVDQQCGTK